MKYRIAALSLVFTLLLPVASSAQTVSDLRSQIQNLFQQLQQLERQLAQSQNSSTPWCHTFSTNLRQGNSGIEVQALQTALTKDGEAVAVTGIFGSRTVSAVIRFQEKYSLQVLVPYGLHNGTGYVGTGTRNLLNAIYGCSGTAPGVATGNTGGSGGGIVPVRPPGEPPIPVIIPVPPPTPTPTPTPTPVPPPPTPTPTPTPLPIPTNTSLDQSEFNAASSWISNCCILPDGAILYANGGTASNQIVPYYGNLAAEGLVKDNAKIPQVLGWMKWYVAHMNARDVWGLAGTVYDYDVTNGAEISRGTADSTDAYAATFLSLALYAWRTGDPAVQTYLKSVITQLDTIGRVITATQDTDGLTWAKPDYHIKYLMDNSEVYRGLSDASLLFSAMGDAAKASYYSSAASNNLAGINSMWIGSAGAWAVYKDNGGNFAAPNFSTWYADATSQLFPTLYGAVSANDTRAQTVYAKFNSAWPNWDTLVFSDPFPWTVIARAAAFYGDGTRVGAYVNSVHAKYTVQNFPWTWYSSENGSYMQLMNYLLGKESAPPPVPTPTPTPTPPPPVPAQPLVTVDTPMDGATLSSPVSVHATYNRSASYMKVWIDHVSNTATIVQNTSTFAASFNLSSGSHFLEFQAADASTGVVYTTPITINVTGSVPPPPPPPPPTPPGPTVTITHIQNRNDWKTCGACGNTGGGGALAYYQMIPSVSSPSLSGSSAQFYIDGRGQAYANAYWYVQQTAQAPTGPVKYLSYSFDIYVPSVPSGVIQAIEFELQQGVNGKTYNFAWQALYAGNQWRTFNYESKQWDSTSVPFTQFAPNSWHHIDTVYHIDPATGAGIHDSISVDGQTYGNLNISYAPSSGGSNYLNNAFQLDTNSQGTPYSAYVDNMQIQFQD